MQGVIIQGSSRKDGNTRKVVELIQDIGHFDVINLSEKNIGPFDYDHSNADDDFLPLMKHIVDHYDLIVFAAPVYWYAMSGILKTFFDRITDCLQLEKETGRKLRGKMTAMVSCGSDSELDPAFSMPFISSANYLGMKYLGDVHTWLTKNEIPDEVLLKIESFVQTINSKVTVV